MLRGAPRGLEIITKGGETMRPRIIILLLVVFVLAITSPVSARSGGHSRGHGHSGWSHHGGHYGGRVYWGPRLYLGYWGWPYYYPPAYYYHNYSPFYTYPPSAYYATPPPTYSTPPPDVSQAPAGATGQAPPAGSQVFFYPRKGQSKEQLSKDQKKCEAWAMEQTGVDVTKPPPTGMPETEQTKKSQDFHRAFEACMDGEGYTIR